MEHVMDMSDDGSLPMHGDDVDDFLEPVEVDCTAAFTTTEVFLTRAGLVSWAKAVGRQLGIVVVISRSGVEKQIGVPGSRIYVSMGCERSGKYRGSKKTPSLRRCGTRKCECPFKLRGRPLNTGEGWILKVVSGRHNHELAETLVGHPYPGRLTTEEMELVGQMTKNMVKPKNILLAIKEGNDHNASTIKTIYNARDKYRKSQRGPRTEMQHLLKLVDRDRYVYWYRAHEASDVVRDIFWAHPDAINLLNCFNIVLMLDTTYKTNRYRLPLLEIVGVTSTNQTFSIAFAYLEAERTDNFTWALLKLKGLFVKADTVPQVFLTDRDIALMNAVEDVFPSSKHMLCNWHIGKNVEAKCKLFVHPKEKWEVVRSEWEAIVDSPTASDYVDRLSAFEKRVLAFPLFVEYVKNTWLIPYKERFVSAWVNQVMHLGNRTTNRVESAHSILKRMLLDSRGDLCTCWDAMSNMITLQHNAINASFQMSINKMDHNHRTNLYSKLRGFSSWYSMDHIAAEITRVKYVGKDSSVCGCTLRKTHGLPCACELARYTASNSPIPLFTLHLHWRRLNFRDEGSHESGSELSLQVELDALLKRFEELDVAGKIALKSKVRELAFPETTSMRPPPEKVKTKGAPKAPKSYASKVAHSTKRYPSYFEHVDAMLDPSSVGSPSKKDKTNASVSNKGTSKSQSFVHVHVMPSAQASTSTQPPLNKPAAPAKVKYLDLLPSLLHEHIDNVINVEGDGNCGYRAVAAGLGMGEHFWSKVRFECLKELKHYREDYVKLFGSFERVSTLEKSLHLEKPIGMQTIDKWMEIPDMGYVVASRYNVVLVCLSISGSCTIFPLRGDAPPLSCHRLLCIGLVSGAHFVQVVLKPGCPLPTTHPSWPAYCRPEALSWQTPYISRLHAYTSLLSMGNGRGNEPKEVVDITED